MRKAPSQKAAKNSTKPKKVFYTPSNPRGRLTHFFSSSNPATTIEPVVDPLAESRQRAARSFVSELPRPQAAQAQERAFHRWAPVTLDVIPGLPTRARLYKAPRATSASSTSTYTSTLESVIDDVTSRATPSVSEMDSPELVLNQEQTNEPAQQPVPPRRRNPLLLFNKSVSTHWLDNVLATFKKNSESVPDDADNSFMSLVSRWYATGQYYDSHTPCETCELCSHEQLRYQFEIKNIDNNNILNIGSKCVINLARSGLGWWDEDTESVIQTDNAKEHIAEMVDEVTNVDARMRAYLF